jgi:hypothetical protein
MKKLLIGMAILVGGPALAAGNAPSFAERHLGATFALTRALESALQDMAADMEQQQATLKADQDIISGLQKQIGEMSKSGVPPEKK